VVVFDPSTTITLTGTLTKVDWRNPHIQLSLEVRGDRGQAEAWAIEAGPPNFFRRYKVDRHVFEDAIGQTVTLQALRARDGSRFGSLLNITFSDGKSVKSSPGA
jgi:hypothetical protein